MHMKKFFIVFMFTFCAAAVYAQNNPYAIFGYKVKPQPKPDSINIFTITNHDPNSKIRYMIVNHEEKVIRLLDNRDSVVQTIPYTDQDIFRWTSIDPHAEKYSSYSPYNYVFNNPVKMIDKNGMDGEVTGSGTKKDPYIIKANYYYVNGSLSDDQVKGLNSAVADYNKLGGKDGVEIKNADGSKSYVKYNLSAVGVKDVQAQKDAVAGTEFKDKNGNDRFYGNKVGIGGSGSGVDYGNATSTTVRYNDVMVQNGVKNLGMNQASLLEGVMIHEIGHNLGGEHDDGTSTMMQITSTLYQNQIGPSQTIISYPSTSKDFTRIIFGRRDTRNQDPNATVIDPGIYTKQDQ